MKSLYIKQTEDTPLIDFNSIEGRCNIIGNSIPENIHLFYDPILEWLDNYIENPQPCTEFNFQMKMISSASSKLFFDILNKIDSLNENKKGGAKVNWYYNIYDDEIREIGLDYKDSMNVPFYIVLVDEE
ncbi:MAG: DUF1987 domain-containing protein [Bacteroidales bacterium]|jgi:hypothetical protein|nr:DUF1987 domain-containing protein [Bacteroidales bacterium]